MIPEKLVKEKIEQLITHVIDLNQANKDHKKIGKRLFRGRAASISNEFENMFASLLDDLLPDKYLIFIDYPISYQIQSQQRKKTSYPDIAIIEEDKILSGIIELKIDLGYLSQDWLQRTTQEVKQLRRATHLSYNTNIGTDGSESRKLDIKPSLPRAIVVLTGKNDHGKHNAFFNQSNCFVLSKDIHPNDKKINQTNRKEILKKIFNNEDNKNSWRGFAYFLNEHFN